VVLKKKMFEVPSYGRGDPYNPNRREKRDITSSTKRK